MHKVTDRYYGADVSMDINPLDYMSSQQMLEHIKD